MLPADSGHYLAHVLLSLRILRDQVQSTKPLHGEKSHSSVRWPPYRAPTSTKANSSEAAAKTSIGFILHSPATFGDNAVSEIHHLQPFL